MDIYIKCPTCDGTGSILKAVRGILMNTLCTTCKGEGGHSFSPKVLDKAYRKRREALRALIWNNG